MRDGDRILLLNEVAESYARSKVRLERFVKSVGADHPESKVEQEILTKRAASLTKALADHGALLDRAALQIEAVEVQGLIAAVGSSLLTVKLYQLRALLDGPD